MPAEQSSLQEAMSRIMGAPAGGTTQQAADTAVEMAPRAPYSQDLETTTPATSLTIGNTPFDPYAEQAAQLAAMQSQTSALQSQLAGGTGAAAAVAPAQPVAKPVASNEPAMISQADLYNRMAMDQQKRYEDMLKAQGQFQGTSVKTPTWAPQAQFAPEAYKTMIANPYATAVQTPQAAAAPAAAPAALTKPVNPGPRAPWQQSAQYWKDLETYRRAGGV